MGNQGNPSVNVIVNVAGPPPIILRSQAGCLVQFIYFLFIGWWLGGIALSIAYFLFLTIIGIPLGVMIINKIPYLIALRQTEPIISFAGVNTPQHSLLIRAIWFSLVGG
jgi:hypothetical protein